MTRTRATQDELRKALELSADEAAELIVLRAIKDNLTTEIRDLRHGLALIQGAAVAYGTHVEVAHAIAQAEDLARRPR